MDGLGHGFGGGRLTLAGGGARFSDWDGRYGGFWGGGLVRCVLVCCVCGGGGSGSGGAMEQPLTTFVTDGRVPYEALPQVVESSA